MVYWVRVIYQMDVMSIVVFVIVSFAAMVQACTGFGFAVVGTPLLLFFLEPKAVVILMVFGAFLLNLMVMHKTRGKAEGRIILPMFLASLAGVVPGVYILKVVDAGTLKLAIGAVTLLVSVAMAANFSFPIRRERLATVVVGMVSGFMGGSTSLSGPPVALFLLNQGRDKEAFRATLVRYFLLGNISTLSVMFYMGTMDGEVVYKLIYTLPGVLVGVWLGEKVFRAVSAAKLRWVSLATVFFCGLISVVGELIKKIH